MIFPGGDTMMIGNFEYRIPIAGPVTVAYFTDVGTTFVLRNSQLHVQTSALSNVSQEFPWFPLPDTLKAIASTNFRPRISTGIEIQAVLPIVNAPVRVFWGYNALREDVTVIPPQTLPPRALFPNEATYNAALAAFRGYRLTDMRSHVGFTVSRTF